MGEFLGNFEFLNDPVEHHHVSMYELYDSNVVINLLNLRGKPGCNYRAWDGFYVCYEVKAVEFVMICTRDVLYKYNSLWIMNKYDASPSCVTRAY